MLLQLSLPTGTFFCRGRIILHEPPWRVQSVVLGTVVRRREEAGEDGLHAGVAACTAWDAADEEVDVVGWHTWAQLLEQCLQLPGCQPGDAATLKLFPQGNAKPSSRRGSA